MKNILKTNNVIIRLLISLALLIGQNLSANPKTFAYQIKVKLENYTESEISLGYYLGNKQYILDTAKIDTNEFFTFSNKEPIKQGVYLIVMKPDNNFFHILITNSEKNFTVYANAKNPIKGIRFEKAPDNTLLYEYLSYMSEMRFKLENLNEEMKSADNDLKKKLEKQRDDLSKVVLDYGKKIVENNPKKFTSSNIRANMSIDVPDFKGTDKDIKKWQFYKNHYFDNISLDDEKMLRTPFLFDKVDYYVNKLSVQHPDSISKSIDLILDKTKPAEETFKYYLIHFLNQFAKSNIVGMDAVYVHLVNKYYAQGLAPWAEKKQLDEIIKNAKALEPLLIGKKAPNLVLETRDKKPLEIHQIESKYTVLYFWNDNTEYKKSIPLLQNFIKNFENRGVKLVAICTQLDDNTNDCWKYIEENNINDWLHLADPSNHGRLKTIYNIKTTPQIYILGPYKNILSKNIGLEKLEEIMKIIIEEYK